MFGHAQKVFLERLGLLRTNSGPTSPIKSLTPIPEWGGLHIYIYIYIYRSEGLPLRDMLSLGAWRMGLGCSGKIFRRRHRRRQIGFQKL